MSNVINVEDYGAVHDDSTDDTDAIQDAIDAGVSNGGTVWLPAGTYRITGSLVMKTGIEIRGSGVGKTIIKPYHAQTHAPVFKTNAAIDFATVRDMTVSFDNCGVTGSPGTPSTHSEDCAFWFGDASDYWLEHSLIENIYVQHAYSAVWDTNGSWDNTFKSVWAKFCGRGFYKSGGTTTRFLNCYAEGSLDSAKDVYSFYLYATFDSVMDACAADKFKANASVYFWSNRGITVNGFYLRLNETPGTGNGESIVYINDNHGISFNGCYALENKINAASSANFETAMVWINGSQGVLNGMVLGRDVKGDTSLDDIVSGGGSGHVTATVLVKDGGARIVMNGCSIGELKTYGSFTGTKFAVRVAAASGGLVTMINPKLVGSTLDESNAFCQTVDMSKYYCSVYRNSDQSNLTDQTTTQVQLDTEETGGDPNGDFDTGAYAYTAPIAGRYLVNACVRFKELVNGKDYMAFIFKNDSNVSGICHHSAASGNDILSVPVSRILDLSAGDTIKLYVHVNTGANTVDIYGGITRTWMQIQLLSLAV